MVFDHTVREGQKGTIRGISELDPGLITDSLSTLVGARRGIAGSPIVFIVPELRIDVLATAKEFAEESDLFWNTKSG